MSVWHNALLPLCLLVCPVSVFLQPAYPARYQLSLSAHQSDLLSAFYLLLCQPACLSIFCLPFSLPTLSVSTPARLSADLSVCPPAYQSLCPFSVFLQACLPCLSPVTPYCPSDCLFTWCVGDSQGRQTGRNTENGQTVRHTGEQKGGRETDRVCRQEKDRKWIDKQTDRHSDGQTSRKVTSHLRGSGGQSFPGGDDKATRNGQDSMTQKTKHIWQKKIHIGSTTFERSLKHVYLYQPHSYFWCDQDK